MSTNPQPGGRRPRTSTRDFSSVQKALSAWLARRSGADSSPTVTMLGGPGEAGFSSETLLFDADWTRAGVSVHDELVLRLPPAADAFPLFPRYEIERQARVMGLVAKRSTAPVPKVRWLETDPSVLGDPFFVMERLTGLPAPDVPPYVFDSWLSRADASKQRRAELGIVEALAAVHDAELAPADLGFLHFSLPGDSSLRRHVANQRAYYDWVRGSHSLPVVECTFDWLERHWPGHEGPDALSWGDARPANILFDDFTPVALLDWEAAGVGPRELDLGWLLFHHQFFQRVAARHGYVGMPGFLDASRIAALYEEITKYEPRDLAWFLVYAELRQALTSIRVWSRAVHFGEREAPADAEELILDRDHLAEVISRPPENM